VPTLWRLVYAFPRPRRAASARPRKHHRPPCRECHLPHGGGSQTLALPGPPPGRLAQCRHLLMIGSCRRRSPNPQEYLTDVLGRPPGLKTDIHAYLEREQPRVLPKSPKGQAIAYTLSNWQALTRYCDNGDLEIDNNGACAASGISGGMPTSGLCRHLNRGSRSTDVPTGCNRHNQRPSRKARRRSGGRYRPGTTPDGLEWASARSLSRMSACK